MCKFFSIADHQHLMFHQNQHLMFHQNQHLMFHQNQQLNRLHQVADLCLLVGSVAHALNQWLNSNSQTPMGSQTLWGVTAIEPEQASLPDPIYQEHRLQTQHEDTHYLMFRLGKISIFQVVSWWATLENCHPRLKIM